LLYSGGTISGGVGDLVNGYGHDRRERLTSVFQVAASGGNAVAQKFVAFTYDIASQMTDMRRYSSTLANPAGLEVHSRYTLDGAARLNSITHARSEIAAGQAWNLLLACSGDK
jgi:hypothetical protein